VTVRFRTLIGLATVAVVLFALAMNPARALAQANPNDPTSGELVETPKAFDGKTLTFQGEAIGDVMVRGDDAWIHLNDDAYMFKNVEEGAALGGFNSGMPVWLPASEAEKIKIVGDYKHQGDIVEVVGTYNAACAQHGGDMDIHATELKVIAAGRRALDPVRPWKLVLALGLTLGAGGLWFAERRISHRERRGFQQHRKRRR